MSAAAMAQDASEQKPVAPAATQVAPAPTEGTPAPAPAVIPPERKGPRDAITGEPVKDSHNPTKPEEKKESLRDKVRSEMH
jgi:hypothetical protein